MRRSLVGAGFGGVVVIGEGEKDEAPMLFTGEVIGDAAKVEWDIAVDPSMERRSPPPVFPVRSL